MNLTDQSTVARKASALPYMPQLDALRAFAVGAVLIHHFADFKHLPYVMGQIPWGFLGVRLFFVLSGFLITGILIESRDRANGSNGSRWFGIRQFYTRRFLRIFPLYYFVIGVLLLLNVQPAREIFLWLLTYTFNIQVSIQGWFPENVSHFWTLSVEEQFYVFWPWLILFAPRRSLIPVICALICLGPLYRLYAVAHELSEATTYCFTLSALDTLGMGALLALVSHGNTAKQTIERFLFRVVLPTGVVATIALTAMSYSKTSWKAYVVLLDTAVALVSCWLISAASRGFKGPVGVLLESRPLVYCGKITYGIYVYHLFMPLLIAPIFGKLGWAYAQRGMVTLLVSSAATFAVASLSWYLMEKPINNLKRHFSYRPKPALRSPSVDYGIALDSLVSVAEAGGSPRSM